MTSTTTEFHIYTLTPADGRTRLTKTISADGRTVPYPHVARMTSTEWRVGADDFQRFAHVLTDVVAATDAHWCLLKGKLDKPLRSESRAGHTDPKGYTHWAVLDIDGLPETALAGSDWLGRVDTLMTAIGAGDVSYVSQQSASAGLKPGMRGHIYFMLSEPTSPLVLKQWLMHLNMTVFAGFITLRPTGTLAWPLDITSCQNDRLIFTAPPTFVDMADPLAAAGEPRWVARHKTRPSFRLPPVHEWAVGVEERAVALRDSMRKAAGLPAIRKKLVTSPAGVTYQPMPGRFLATGQRTARGFTYYNLNGGDSWGYYHPEDDATYLYNFKDEPVYLMKEVLPEEHTAWLARAVNNPEATAEKPCIYVYRNANGPWTLRAPAAPGRDALVLTTRNQSEFQLMCAQYRAPCPEVIPTWTEVYEPSQPPGPGGDQYRPTYNTFVPSTLLLARPNPALAGAHPTIDRLIDHLMVGDKELSRRFVNWLAYILQTRRKTGVAWVISSVPGTGKNTLYDRVLQPLLGEQNTAVRNANIVAEEKFNSFMAEKLLVVMDEAHIADFRDAKQAMAKFKTFITERRLAIRKMFQDSYEAPSYCNLMFFSNDRTPLALEQFDRRFVVTPFQTVPLREVEPAIRHDSLSYELTSFYHTLMTMQVDEDAACTAVSTQAKAHLVEASETDKDAFFRALKAGNIAELQEWLPDLGTDTTPAMAAMKWAEGIQVLSTWIKERPPVITLGEITAVYAMAQRKEPLTSRRIAMMARSAGLELNVVWSNNRTQRGFRIQWQNPPETTSA